MCLNVFWWAKFRKTKAGINLHTLFDIETQTQAFVHKTPAKVHDMNDMNVISYKTGEYYVFDRGYFDFMRLNHITQIVSYFVIRERSRLQYEVIKDQNTNHNADGIMADQIIKLIGYASSRKYPEELCKVIYYAEYLNNKYVYLTNKVEAFTYQIISTGGMWNCSLSGLNSILKLNPFGVQPKELLIFIFLQLL